MHAYLIVNICGQALNILMQVIGATKARGTSDAAGHVIGVATSTAMLVWASVLLASL